MKIVDVILTKSYTGFYFDDQKAIKQGAGHDVLYRRVSQPTPRLASAHRDREEPGSSYRSDFGSNRSSRPNLYPSRYQGHIRQPDRYRAYRPNPK